MGLFFGFGGELADPHVALYAESLLDTAGGTLITNDPNPPSLDGEFGTLEDINDIVDHVEDETTQKALSQVRDKLAQLVADE